MSQQGKVMLASHTQNHTIHVHAADITTSIHCKYTSSYTNNYTVTSIHVYYIPYFQYVLRALKDCEFCEWTVVRKTIIAIYLYAHLKCPYADTHTQN